ncbi:MAG: hypothetical protein J7J22_05790 [Candidatus Verstraetearchaeota archaeon]|nr:hypothetical protein [Candidatus Verstraetearchaeota archaeon]
MTDNDSLFTFLGKLSEIRASYKKGELEELLNLETINELQSLNVLTLKESKKCPDGEIIKKREKGKFIELLCSSGRVHRIRREAYEKEYYVYDVNYRQLFKLVLEKIGIHVKEQSIIDEGSHYLYQNDDFTIIFLLTSIKKPKDYFKILYPLIKEKVPVILIGPKAMIPHLLDILEALPLGNLLYPLPFNYLSTESVKKNLEEWVDSIKDIHKLEQEILDQIKNEELKELMATVESNPRYLLSLLTHLKTLKILSVQDPQEFKREDIAKYMEYVTVLAFRYLTGVDVSIGGNRNIGKRVPDAIVFIRGSKSDSVSIIGIVDCKSSLEANFEKELTEKYIHYVNLIRGTFPLKVKIPLIFVLFGIESKKFLQFHNRVIEYLSMKYNGEFDFYTIIMPLEALTTMISSYLSVILHEVDLSRNSLIALIREFFDEEYLKEIKHTKTEKYVQWILPLVERDNINEFLQAPRLYILTSEMILDEIKSKIEESSNVKEILKRIPKT